MGGEEVCPDSGQDLGQGSAGVFNQIVPQCNTALQHAAVCPSGTAICG